MTERETVVSSDKSDQASADARGLMRVLGLAFGLAVLVGNTIGMGILRTPGEIAAQLPSVPLYIGVWVIGAMYALLGALTVAELSAMRPRSGGLYPMVHHALGPYLGFVSGWADWISTCCSIAAVAMVIGEYVVPMSANWAGREVTIGSTVIVGFFVLQWRGVRVGAGVQLFSSALKAVALLGLVALVFLVGDSSSATREIPLASASTLLPVGTALIVAVVLALQAVIFTFDGWTGPVYFGEEVRDPGRDLPRAMIGGVLLVLGLYLLINLAYLSVLTIEQIAGDPFVAATVAKQLFGASGEAVLRVLMVVSLLASVSALLLMASRVPYAMSADGLFPARFARVDVGGTPRPALLLTTLVALGFILTNSFATALALMAFFFVANYVLVFVAYFVERRRSPNASRPFRTPGYPFVPGLALAVSLAFVVAALIGDPRNSAVAVILLALSWPVYWFVRRGKSAKSRV